MYSVCTRRKWFARFTARDPKVGLGLAGDGDKSKSSQSNSQSLLRTGEEHCQLAGMVMCCTLAVIPGGCPRIEA